MARKRQKRVKLTKDEAAALERAITAAGSQKELAKRLHVTEGTVSRWVNGHGPPTYHREGWVMALGEVKP